MSDLRERLVHLTELAGDPEPMDELRRRAHRYKTRRRLAQGVAGLVGLAMIAGVGIAVAGLLPDRDSPVIGEGSVGVAPHGWTTFETGDVTFHYPQEWTVALDREDGRVVVSSQPLSTADARRALLVRPDIAFTDALPSDATVVAVGGDRLLSVFIEHDPQARPTVGGLDQLGDEVTLSVGDVRARFATLSSSTIRVGVYAGSTASNNDWTAAERIVDTITVLSRTDSQPSPPPPPATGDSAWEDATREIMRVLAGTQVVVLRVGERCVVMGTFTSDPPGNRVRAQGHDCELPHLAVGTHDLVIADPAMTQAELPPPPSAEWPMDESGSAAATESGSMLVMGRAGEGIVRAEARLVDGSVSNDTHLMDGWLLAVAPGRIIELVGFDEHGREVAVVWVP